MYIESIRHSDGTWIPHIRGELVRPFAGFLVNLRTKPKKFGGMRTSTTVNNAFTALKIWFDFLADQSVPFDQATYEKHLLPFQEGLLANGTEPQSYNNYYGYWRSFYEWCDEQKIPHLMSFPAKLSLSKKGDSDNDMLAHTRHHGEMSVELDPGKLTTTSSTDYRDVIINDEQFSQLSEKLRNNDVVYEMIAYMMITTGLRIGGVEQIPVGATERNPEWLRYPELKRTGKPFQKLRYLPKGKKEFLTCIVLTEALEVLHNNYLRPVRPKRAKLFEEKRGVLPDNTQIWLTSKGKLVTQNDIWAAFRKASEELGRTFEPHYLRHTYATYVVYNYFKANGIKPNLAYAHDIHEQLRKQLGHRNLETTKRYIRTVITVEAEAWLPELTPRMKAEVDCHTPGRVMEAVSRFFEPLKHL